MSVFKVLLPLDGSRVAERALVYLDALKAMGELDVELLTVVDRWMEEGVLPPEEVESREDNLLSTYLREVAGDIKRHSQIEAKSKVIHGNPSESVIDEAKAFAPDLLVISTHGRTGASRWRLGSVADKVIRGVGCDMLVAGPGTEEHERWMDGLVEAPFKSILVPLDGSDLAEAALVKAKAMADAYGSTVHFVRSVQIPVAIEGYAGQVTYVPDLLEGVMESAELYLQEVVARAGLKSTETSVILGPPASVLEDYVKKHDIDLVIMTSHGRSGIVRTALGSVTDRLLAVGAAPVLIVRSLEV